MPSNSHHVERFGAPSLGGLSSKARTRAESVRCTSCSCVLIWFQTFILPASLVLLVTSLNTGGRKLASQKQPWYRWLTEKAEFDSYPHELCGLDQVALSELHSLMELLQESKELTCMTLWPAASARLSSRHCLCLKKSLADLWLPLHLRNELLYMSGQRSA